MTALPTGWKRSPLREVCDIVSGGTPKTGVADFWGGIIAWVTPNDLSKDRSQTIAHGERQLTAAGYASCSASTFPAGSVIVSSRAPIGYVAIAGQEMCTNQGCKTAVPPDFIDSKYLYWYLLNAKADLQSRASGTTFKEISGKGFGETQLVWPELHEQRRIIDILEDHISRLDAAEADLNNAYRRASSLRTAVVCAELARFEGPHRTIHQLSESVRNGIFVSRAKAEPNGVPILRIGAVRPLSLDLGDLRYSERDELDLQREDSLLAPGDLLFTRYNGNPRFVGACAVVPENAGPLTYPDKLIRVRISAREAVPDYVALACTVGAGREQIHSHVKTTSGQAGISGRDLKAVTLVVPSIEHQQAVVVAAHQRLDAVVELSKMISVSVRRCGSLRGSLLAAAFSGRLSGRISDMEMVEEMAGV